MTPQNLIDIYRLSGKISVDIINAIQTDSSLRKNLVEYFKKNQDHEFVIAVLDELIRLRPKTNVTIPMEDLMFASYLLTLHGQIKDCLKIWEAKMVDFDTYCGFDTQLVFFAGLNKTTEYLKAQKSDEAKEALKFIADCEEPEDFDLKENDYPWFV